MIVESTFRFQRQAPLGLRADEASRARLRRTGGKAGSDGFAAGTRFDAPQIIRDHCHSKLEYFCFFHLF
jgi:hypothetical protein